MRERERVRGVRKEEEDEGEVEEGRRKEGRRGETQIIVVELTKIGERMKEDANLQRTVEKKEGERRKEEEGEREMVTVVPPFKETMRGETEVTRGGDR